jgi:hypothetical protein
MVENSAINQLYQVRVIAYNIRSGRVYDIDLCDRILSRTRPYKNYIYLTEPDITLWAQLPITNYQLPITNSLFQSCTLLAIAPNCNPCG